MLFSNQIEKIATKYAEHSMQSALKKNFKLEVLEDDFKKNPQIGREYMLYIHVPFCHTFCPFCSFHKYQYDENKARAYFASLREELAGLKEAGYDFKTLYIGGGTTLIHEDELEKTLLYIKDKFGITEVSAETDPSHIKPEQLHRFKGLIDRLSVGVQSFNDDTLKRVARYDKFGSASVIRNRIEKALGIFDELSIDLIFNLPQQSTSELLHDIDVVKKSGAQQVTFYPLMRSNLTTKTIERSLGAKMQDNERDYYDIICENMADYERTNAWAFALKPSRLKDEYVGSGVDFIGAGSGAFSFTEGALLVNVFNLDEYTRRVSQKQSTVLARCEFALRDRVRYRFVTALFDGEINIDDFNIRNGCNILSDMSKELTMLRLAGAVDITDRQVKSTHFGRYLSVVMMREFYSGMDMVRATFRDNKSPKVGLQDIFKK